MRSNTRLEGLVRAITNAMAGWPFAVFLLTTLLLATSLMALVTLIPMEGTAMEKFAEEFKVWCFGYDPRTGRMEWAAVITLLTGPILLGGLTLLVWWPPLREVVVNAPRRVVLAAGPAAFLVGAASVATVYAMPEPPLDPTVFPSKALRTEHTPPAFDLIDHEGNSLSLDTVKSRIVVLTGIYSTCGSACPMIMAQIKGALEGLTPEAQAQVSIVAITLDPERDTTERMAAMAKAYRVAPPQVYFATGDSAAVNATLDRLGIERKRNPETGVIDHASMFLLIDRTGHIAYRFGVGDLQRQWMTEALRLLVAERGNAA